MFNDILVTLEINASQKFEGFEVSESSYKSNPLYLGCVDEIVNLLKDLHLTELKSRSHTQAYEGWEFDYKNKVFKVYFLLNYEKSGITQANACVKKLLNFTHSLKNKNYDCFMKVEL
jgi:hypothetical protein